MCFKVGWVCPLIECGSQLSMQSMSRCVVTHPFSARISSCPWDGWLWQRWIVLCDSCLAVVGPGTAASRRNSAPTPCCPEPLALCSVCVLFKFKLLPSFILDIRDKRPKRSNSITQTIIHIDYATLIMIFGRKLYYLILCSFDLYRCFKYVNDDIFAAKIFLFTLFCLSKGIILV